MYIYYLEDLTKFGWKKRENFSCDSSIGEVRFNMKLLSANSQKIAIPKYVDSYTMTAVLIVGRSLISL